MKTLDFKDKPIIGMVHLKPLPGSAKYHGSMKDVIYKAIDDANILVNAGIDAIMIENDGDQPYEIQLNHAQLAALSSVASAVRSKFEEIPMGISAAFNDYQAGLSIAYAAGAQFIRIPVFVDMVVSSCGVIHPVGPKAIKYRSALGADNIKILADIQVKYTKMLIQNISIEESAVQAQSCGADAVIVTGTASGDVPPIDAVSRVRKVLDIPVLVGSGIDKNNVKEQMTIADGAIVGTTFKTNGNIDAEKVIEFMKVLRS